jgi:hypothetical protein
VASFFDATCPGCGARLGWCGERSDRTPCRRCGRSPSPDEVAEPLGFGWDELFVKRAPSDPADAPPTIALPESLK